MSPGEGHVRFFLHLISYAKVKKMGMDLGKKLEGIYE